MSTKQRWVFKPLADKELLSAGPRFGHKTSIWNPKMKPYIFGKRILFASKDNTVKLWNAGTGKVIAQVRIP